MFVKRVIYFTLLLFVYVKATYEGDTCEENGRIGTCLNFRDCPTAIENRKAGKNPKLCSFNGSDPIICCINGNTQTLTTTTKRPTTSTTEYVPVTYDYEDADPNKANDEKCAPIPPSQTSPKSNQKAWNKCLEYQEKYVFPCAKSKAMAVGYAREHNCHHDADQLIIGGVDAAEYEFPHMVVLGHADPLGAIKWQCGGALISEKYILTGGHCIADKSGWPVSDVMVGVLNKNVELNDTNHFKVKKIIPHPDYHSPYKYNDIALLELDRTVTLNQFLVPACLHVGDKVDDNRALATGWGHTAYHGHQSEILQKVVLAKFNYHRCAALYQDIRHMKQGVNSTIQMCYGDEDTSKDTCEGDSGGPLQIKSKKMYCMYVIIGVTSFGRACGFPGEPTIYTRVAPYIPWIESIVWPN